MQFEEAVGLARTLTDLRRIAGAHVVDHKQLTDDELRSAMLKVKPQYLHHDTIQSELDEVLFKHDRKDCRVLSRIIIADVLLNNYGFTSSFSQTEGQVIAFEQSIIDRSNETDLIDLACGNKQSARFENLSLYQFVLETAWQHHNQVSPDEANLLMHLRQRLGINETDHRILEAKLGKYPKPDNELHTRSEIKQVRLRLQEGGLLFPIRQEDGQDFDVIPEEMATTIRMILNIDVRTDAYYEMMKYNRLRRRPHLISVLEVNGVAYDRYDVVDTLVSRVMADVPASRAIANPSPRYGLNSDEISRWCRDLGIPTSGTMNDRTARIVRHFDELRPRLESEADERATWYEYFEELAARDHTALRAQHVVDKDIEIESRFEDATNFLFAEKLKHQPLRQAGSEHCDGIISFRSGYLMWDNKSSESTVNLAHHIDQFDRYMEKADKPVPIFLVIGPDFSENSEVAAIRHHSEHFDRNIVAITAGEIKMLAEEWASIDNKNRDEPFPLGLLAAPGRFVRARIGKLY